MEDTNKELNLNQYALQYLKESAKWSYFLSIVGFIGITFMVLFALLFNTIMSNLPMMGEEMGDMQNFPGAVFSGMYLLIAVIYFFPIYYLYKYAVKAKEAIQNSDSETLSESLRNLKSHHTFLGVMMLIVLSMYLLFAIIALIGYAYA